MKRYPWETWQEQFIKDNYAKMSAGRIARFLNRTAQAVRLKHFRMMKQNSETNANNFNDMKNVSQETAA